MKRIFAVILAAALLCGCGEARVSAADAAITPISQEARQISRSPAPMQASGLITHPASAGDIPLWAGSAQVNCADLSALDLSDEKQLLSRLSFNTVTKWPALLPAGFDPAAILENGKNPGLGVRALHDLNITGTGVNLAIIDYPLYIEHPEYAGRLRYYAEENVSGGAEMHASLTASLAVGQDTGTAPGAALWFIAANNVATDANKSRVLDFTGFAAALDALTELNKTLPESDKIRVASISAGWSAQNPGASAMDAAVARAMDAGIFVITCNTFDYADMWLYGAYKAPDADPETPKSYTPYDWDTWLLMNAHIDGFCDRYAAAAAEYTGEMLLVPIGSRTVAYPTGETDYAFSSDGGWSSMMPYLAGIYAMALQIDPDLTPQQFYQAALATGTRKTITGAGGKTYAGRLLAPRALIASLQK